MVETRKCEVRSTSYRVPSRSHLLIALSTRCLVGRLGRSPSFRLQLLPDACAPVQSRRLFLIGGQLPLASGEVIRESSYHYSRTAIRDFSLAGSLAPAVPPWKLGPGPWALAGWCPDGKPEPEGRLAPVFFHDPLFSWYLFLTTPT